MDWRSIINDDRFSFCGEDEGLATSVVDLLCRNLFGDKIRAVLQERYAKMRNNFCVAEQCPAEWRQTTGLLNDSDSESDRQAAVLDVPRRFFDVRSPIRQLLKDFYNCGHDLPVWFSVANSDLRLLIVGQDPMRNNHKEKGHLYLSSPWALHSCSFKKCGRTRNLMAWIAKECHAQIYVTDYAKLYFSNVAKNHDMKLSRPRFDERFCEVCRRWSCAGLYSKILAEEMRIFKPDVTVFMGKDVCMRAGVDWIEDDAIGCHPLFGRYVSMRHPNAHGLTNDAIHSSFGQVVERINRSRRHGV